jgi:hypothetical protein
MRRDSFNRGSHLLGPGLPEPREAAHTVEAK